ncbi:MAG: hypothetical protein M1827_002315 [Pycnora praestabilis]|nr:MAG: hypothetical protein M1827_002315 [Pycnora praestabilis]
MPNDQLLDPFALAFVTFNIKERSDAKKEPSLANRAPTSTQDDSIEVAASDMPPEPTTETPYLYKDTDEAAHEFQSLSHGEFESPFAYQRLPRELRDGVSDYAIEGT